MGEKIQNNFEHIENHHFVVKVQGTLNKQMNDLNLQCFEFF